MQVQVITKAGCARCLLAKDKLKRLGVEYTEILAGPGHTGEAPIIVIEGVHYSYADAMRVLKERLDSETVGG